MPQLLTFICIAGALLVALGTLALVWLLGSSKQGGKSKAAGALEWRNEIFLPEVGRCIAEGKRVTITAKGNSMRPFLESERDKVVLAAAGELRVGDAVLAEISKGVFVLHRIISIDGDRLTLQGDGNVRGVEHCRRSKVLGVLTEYVYPDRTVLATDASLCRRIKLWRRLRPIRRYLLFIYRKLIIR